MKTLFITDPLHTLDYPNDTSVSLMKAFHNKKLEVFHCDFKTISNVDTLLASQLMAVKNDLPVPLQWAPQNTIAVNEFSIIFHRKDPPVDRNFKNTCKLFEGLTKKTIQINNPYLIANTSEKLLALEFPKHCIPTTLITSLKQLENEIRSSTSEVVLKPIDLFSGRGIKFFSNKTTKSELDNYYNKYGPEVILQNYIPEAETLGDLRVLMFNKEHVGSFLRKAAPGSRLQNLHQGGSAHPWALTRKQEEASSEVSSQLANKGIYFIGIDFLGDKISEINITSPMGIVQINQLYKTQSESIVINQCLELFKQRTSL